jgi:hypothetical protein
MFFFLLHISQRNCDRLVSAESRIWLYTWEVRRKRGDQGMKGGKVAA